MTKLNTLKIDFKENNEKELRAEILVDNSPITNSDYVVDLDELEKSIDYHGKFFIVTCESNEENYIHLSKGIDIKRDDSENIQWKLAPEFKNDTVFTFDNDEYRKAILSAIDNWKKIVSDKEENHQLSYQDIHSYVKYSDIDDEE